jgi:O-antigen/teichoic acid export membrane protein
MQSLNSLVNIVAVPSITIGMIAIRFSAEAKANNDPNESRQIFHYLNEKILKYGLPFFGLTLLFTPWLGDFLKIESRWAVMMVWIFMLFSFLASVNTGINSGWQRFRKSGMIGVWGAVAKLLGGVALVSLGFGINGVMGSFLLGILASYLASFLAIRFIFSKSDKKTEERPAVLDFRSVKKIILPVFLGNLAINILGNIDVVLAKHNLDAEMAGQYGALAIVAKIIFFATGVIPGVLLSMSAEKHYKNEGTRNLFRKAVLLLLLLSLVATVVYFLAPKLILGLLFGTKYASVSGYLGWFAVLATAFSLANLLFQYLLSIHKEWASLGFLGASLGMILVVLWGGKSIQEIIIWSTLFQLLAIAVGVLFLPNKREQINAEIDFPHYPDL